MGNTRGTWCLFSRPFRKRGVIPLATNSWNYKKHDIVDIKGMSTIQEEMSHKCYHAKTGWVYSVTQHAVGIAVTNKGKIPAKRINVDIEYIVTLRAQIPSWNMWRQMTRERRKPKEKVFVFNRSARAAWEPVERSLSSWNPSPIHS